MFAIILLSLSNSLDLS